MDKVRFIGDVRQIRSLWEKIYMQGMSSPYQSYRAQLIYQQHFYFYYKSWNCFYKYVVLEDKDNAAILPIMIDRGNKTICCFFRLSNAAYFDMLILKPDAKVVSLLMDVVQQRYPKYRMSFAKLLSNSSLYYYFKSKGQTLNPTTCVAIHFNSNDYSEYYSSLSKHQRQNVRTAYNKLGKDGISFRIVKYSKLPAGLWQKCIRMYEQRMLGHWGGRESLYSTVRIGFSLLRKRYENPMNYVIRHTDDKAWFVLFFGDEPVAYMAGLYTYDHESFIVPKLSVSEKYLSYSPGIVMLNESIKLLLNEGVCVCDLATGDEPYKYAMGGVEHYTYSCEE